ncbi:MAG TPA: acyltransferase [Ramlibacter sp.]|uniref:acyltransferase family protein n=1 Tax=Ramlibacter sp. TaxID=1917967 RepID=UPI002ED0210A
MKSDALTRDRSDALRGVACVGVVLYHMAHTTPGPSSPFYWLAGTFLGLGVPLFFMISAFALASRYADGIDSRQALARYATRRVMRIYPLYLALLLCLLYRNGPTLSAGQVALYASLLFAVVPALAEGLVWASWSIGVEVLFYCAFPLILRAAPSTATLLAVAVTAHIVSLLLAPFTAPAFTGSPRYYAIAWHQYIPFFALGLAAFRLQTPLIARGSRSTFGLVALMVGSTVLAAVTLTLPGRPLGFSYVHLLIASTLPLFCLMLWIVTHPPVAVVNPLTLYLGKISYSIFLLHPYVVYKLKPVYLAIQREVGAGGVAFALSAAITFAVVLPLAALCYRWIEAPAIRLGARWTRNKGLAGIPVPVLK